ncbi:L-threonine 3-dehydrogenase [Botrimarina colliarenosi]|uniref:alcohol dehydrogenase n=1 Tax=Botrimarina colliarenosi TaxID=2528001 RepID=A0A5C6AFV0_9BACT|nr:zinc-binding dehydrogenase [Botrimarina colliarenosi]TWT98075.1 L-threonine 3-dehydrogenase [Botrimarina colliarenosi]
MPTTARAAVMTAPNRPLALRDFPVPEARPGEVLARITLATICGSDLHTWRGRRHAATPIILGHEAVGVVEQIGSDGLLDRAGRPLSVGDRITWTLHSSCGVCDYCVRYGLPMKCRSVRKFGHESCERPPHLRGALAEKCLLSAGTGLLRVPDSLSDLASAPANCAAATAIAVCDAAGIESADSVLVQGAGALGVYAAGYAATAGCKRVIVTDLSPRRLELARDLGATHVVRIDGQTDAELAAQTRELAGGDGVDAVLGFSGSPAACSSGLDALRVGGVFVEAGCVFPGAVSPIDLSALVSRRLTLRGVHNYALDHLRRAVDFLTESDHRYDCGRVVGETFPLEDVNAAFAAAEKQQSLRIAVAMGAG